MAHGALCLALVLLSAAAPARAELTLGQLPQFDDLALAPDGEHLLLVRNNGEVYDLQVKHLASGDVRTLFAADKQGSLINWCNWATHTRIVCSVRSYKAVPQMGQIAFTRMFAVNADGSEHLSLIRPVRYRVGSPLRWDPQVQDRVVNWLSDDPEHILVQLNRDRHNRPSVYRLNIHTNTLERVQRQRGMVRRWYADNEGRVRLAIGYRRSDTPVVYRVRGRNLRAYDARTYASDIPPQPLGFSADGEQVFISMSNGLDRHGIYRVALDDGEVLEEIYRDPQFDVFGGLLIDPATGEPLGVSYLRHHPHMVFFDIALAALFGEIEARLPGEHYRVISADQNYQRFVLYAYGGIAPRYYLYDRSGDLYDRSGNALTLLGADYPGLADAEVVDLSPFTYQSRDGLRIPAYLAQPPGPGPHPTVLLPHGGPYSRDSAEFDAWTQFLVGQGYAVLKPNYRGSVGYGAAHMQAGYKQWGLKMQEDLMDGLDTLVRRGVADPERVCVVGASYGGYTALVSAYKYADKIDCAVSVAGISNLERMVQRLYNFDLARRNRARIQGTRDLVANSPIRQADAFNVPVLLLHGNRDTVVRVKQSRELARALTRLGKPHRYVEQEFGDHFLSMGSQRREFFSEMGAFLDQHLAP